MKVLVADDEVLVRFAVKLALKDMGHDTREAGDGAAVIAALQEDPPDALVLDLFMPKMTGYEVLRWMQQHECRVPVVILSAFVVEADEFDDLRHVVAVLQKPLYVDQLHTALQQCEERLVYA